MFARGTIRFGWRARLLLHERRSSNRGVVLAAHAESAFQPRPETGWAWEKGSRHTRACFQVLFRASSFPSDDSTRGLAPGSVRHTSLENARNVLVASSLRALPATYPTTTLPPPPPPPPLAHRNRNTTCEQACDRHQSTVSDFFPGSVRKSSLCSCLVKTAVAGLRLGVTTFPSLQQHHGGSKPKKTTASSPQPAPAHCSLVPQGEELSPGLVDAGNAGDHGDAQALPPERPLRDASEVSLFHQILVSKSKRATFECREGGNPAGTRERTPTGGVRQRPKVRLSRAVKF